MDDVKSTYRDVKTDAKKAMRSIGGRDIKDTVGNAGDELAKDLGNVGDELREVARDPDTLADDPVAAPERPA